MKAIILFSLLINLPILFHAQQGGELVRIGGSGTVNPLIFESFSDNRLIVGGTFRGVLEIQGQESIAIGGDDIFIGMFDGEELNWLQTFGSTDNDAVVDRVWQHDDASLTLFIVFWDMINIGGENIWNPPGGQALIAVKINTSNGEIISSHLFAVQGAIRDVRVQRINEGSGVISGRIEGNMYDQNEETIVADFGGIFIGQLDNDLNFILSDTIKTEGRCILAGIAVKDEEVLLVGFFNGRLTFDGQIEQTISVYDNAYAVKVDINNGGGQLKRFGGIFDNNFIGAVGKEGDWYVSGHYTGVLELGDGQILETGNFNSNFVFLQLDDSLKVLATQQSLGLSVVRNFGMRFIENSFYFGNQYFEGYGLGSINVSCGNSNLASSIVSLGAVDFSVEENFCFFGNVNNPLFAAVGGGVFSFTTNDNFEFREREYTIEGVNDGFLYFRESNSISDRKENSKVVNIFPNPARGFINVEVEEDLTLEIFNMQGQLMERKLMWRGSIEQIIFNTAGMYLIGPVGGKKDKILVIL